MTTFDPDRLAHQFGVLGHDEKDKVAAARALKYAMERLRMQKFVAAVGKVDERKAAAALDPDVVGLEDRWLAALAAADHAGVDFDQHKTYIEMLRTEQSNRRAEMGLR